MKLVVQIPCYNEEATISSVVKSIPKKIKGIKQILILVVDDGSTDNSLKEIKKSNPDYIISNKRNLGLAKTFSKAINKSLEIGADIIVNTDADNQYDQGEIKKLLKPILDRQSDMVIGNRQVSKIEHMPLSKKIGNIIGSFALRLLTDCNIGDASSGFRAFTKEVAENFNIRSGHTYTHETIIQTIFNGFVISEIPIKFKKRKYGESRLIDNIWKHIKLSSVTIIRGIILYKAFKYLVTIGSFIASLGIIIGLRFLFFYFQGLSNGHIQSLILASILISLGANTIFLGIIADLISAERKSILEIKSKVI